MTKEWLCKWHGPNDMPLHKQFGHKINLQWFKNGYQLFNMGINGHKELQHVRTNFNPYYTYRWYKNLYYIFLKYSWYTTHLKYSMFE